MVTIQQAYLLNQETNGDVIDGMDFPQGNPIPLAILLPYNGFTTNAYAGVYFNPTTKELIVKQNGAVLSGYNFSGISVEVWANNVTIQNCTFNDQCGYYAVVQNSGYSGLTVANCTFNGGDNVNLASFITSVNGYITIANNSFIDTPSHAVQLTAGVVENNYFSGAGFLQGAHADAINVLNTTGPVSITGNYVDWTNTSGALMATNNAIRITTDIGPVSDVTVTNNVLLGGQYTVYVDYGNDAQANGGFSNVVVSNNYIGDYVYGPYYGTAPAGATYGSYTDVGFNNPALSAAAWAANQASLTAATNNFVEATPASTTISAASAGSSTLYGDGLGGLHLDGGKGLTIFVGGAGTQFMWGGAGKNIYSYLSVADSTTQSSDAIGNFNVASDVIDLHALNANPASGQMTNFTFIGSAPFSSAGGEVQVTQDAAANLTLVSADLVGDSSADLEIRLNGLLNLTAANFALTNAQFTADIAAYTTVAEFESSQSSLDQVAGGFSIVDTAANVQADLSGLEADAGNIDAVTLSGSTAASPATLALTSAAAASDAAILAKIVSPYVLDTTTNYGTTTVTGYGNGLTIDVVAGDYIVTGGGTSETFYFSAQFGSTQITDFATNANSSTTHDTISLSTTDFANWATLLSDGKASGVGNANTTFTAADGASLTVVGVTLSSFQHPTAQLQSDFKFHA